MIICIHPEYRRGWNALRSQCIGELDGCYRLIKAYIAVRRIYPNLLSRYDRDTVGIFNFSLLADPFFN
jgi:hypothetical protein